MRGVISVRQSLTWESSREQELRLPYQNRVDPFGEIHAVAARGLFTGNRGTIHDGDTRTLLKRRWASKMWIICDCGYRGRKRDVMGRNKPPNSAGGGGPGWTNLFFADEVTALAAGHRPCFECRRERAKEFARCFAAGQGLSEISAPAIDAILHPQRRAVGAAPLEFSPVEIKSLPGGAMVTWNGVAYAVRGNSLMRWSFDGYAPVAMPLRAELLTPPATVAALRAGYRPVWARESAELPPP